MSSKSERKLEVFKLISLLYDARECRQLDSEYAANLVNAAQKALQEISTNSSSDYNEQVNLRMLAWLAACPANVPPLLGSQCLTVVAKALALDVDQHEKAVYWAAVCCYHVLLYNAVTLDSCQHADITASVRGILNDF